VAIVRNRGKNARNVSQKIWLSSAEAERIKDAAGDVPVASWLRDLALGQPSKPRPPLMQRKAQERSPQNAAYIQPLALAVARVGNNLNQIARAVNIDLKERNPMDAVFVATQLAQIRREMREELRAVSESFWREAKGAGEDPEAR
jgi:Bacterial mobilisation protein (MobC)